MRYILLTVAVLMLFCSCAVLPQESTLQAELPQTETQLQLPPEQEEKTDEIISDVSPLAKEYFLEPQEEYSWEREFPSEKIVLHFTSAVMLSRETPYDMTLVRSIFEENKLSIHYIIDRDGKIYCYMPESRCAWHAGAGTYGGDEKYTNAMNRYSFGIELVAMGSQKDMAQYLTP
ncbi:MAG: N-acetylmuramoyl-L-alanine amidase, partial [Clostridia bacterium]|nr:N-acetylmuramoyl-L-alanine amidase [Clostridia bacterium]